MCSPTLAITAITTVVSAYGQKQAADAEAKAITRTAENNQKIQEYNAKVSDVNADINARAAKDALQRGSMDAANIKENARAANARGRAVLSGTGLISDKGTGLNLQVQNTGVGTENALNAYNNAEREAYGYKIAETNDRAEARNKRYQGQLGLDTAAYQSSAVRQKGLYDAAGTLVTGAGDFGKIKWSKPSAKTRAGNIGRSVYGSSRF